MAGTSYFVPPSALKIPVAGYICEGDQQVIDDDGLKGYSKKKGGNILVFEIHPHEEKYTHPDTAVAAVAVNGISTVDRVLVHDRVHHVPATNGPPEPKRSKNGQGEDEGEFKVWIINIFCTDGLEQGLLHGNSGQCQRVLTDIYRTIAEYDPVKALMFFRDLKHHISPLSITLMFACDVLMTMYDINDRLFHPLPPIPADNGDRLSQDTTACMSHRKCRRLILYRENLLRNKNGLEHRLASKEDKYECVIKAPTLWEIYGTFKNVDPNLLSKGWEPAL